MEIVPYDLFVRFLVTKGLLDTDEINDHLSQYGLVEINNPILNRHWKYIRSAVSLPVVKQIETRKQSGQTFLRWMGPLDLQDIWLNEPQYRSDSDAAIWTLVYDIMTDPTVRYATNAMLLKESKLDELARSLNAKFSTLLNRNHLELYRKYFWNPMIMTRSGWRNYLAASENSYEIDLLFTALSDTIDVLRTKLGLPATLQVSESIQFMATEALQKVKHYVKLGDRTGNTEARYWMGVAENLLAKYDKLRSADLRDFSKELQMEFEHVETEFATPDDTVIDEVKQKGMRSEEDTDVEPTQEPLLKS